MIRRLGASQAVAMWPQLAPHLRRALAHGPPTHDLADILAEVASGELSAFVAETPEAGVLAVLLAEIVTHPRYRACAICWAGGRFMRRWLPAMRASLIAWARGEGCRRIECRGRPGWRRAANFRPEGQFMSMEI